VIMLPSSLIPLISSMGVISRIVPGPFSPGETPSGEGFTLLVFGGSQGARRINEAMCAAAAELKSRIPGFRVVHQSGAADRERVRKAYEDARVEADVRTFIDDMGAAYGRADLVLCRAGATTVAELTALGKPAILVPYPFAADDHQTANGAVLAERGAAILVPDGELTGERLGRVVSELAADRERLAAMASSVRELAVPDAAERVAQVCFEVAEKGSTR